jgi:hypothetical protein
MKVTIQHFTGGPFALIQHAGKEVSVMLEPSVTPAESLRAEAQDLRAHADRLLHRAALYEIAATHLETTP